MNNDIGVGILVALTFTSTIFILRSSYFTKTQKTVLGLLFIFPPAQWLIAIILAVYNKNSNVTTGFTTDKSDKYLRELTQLKNNGLLTENEYQTKKEEINLKKEKQNLESTKDYRTLKKLRDENILSKEEFEQKVELLKSKFRESRKALILLDKDLIIGKWMNHKQRVDFLADNVFHYYAKYDQKSPTIGKWVIYESTIIIRFSKNHLQFQVLNLTKNNLSYKHNKTIFDYNRMI